MTNLVSASRCCATLLLALLASCGDGDGEGTFGQEDRVRFAYQRGCLFGCPIEQPLLVGTRHAISVSDEGDGANVIVESSKPEVAEFALERQCYCEWADGDQRIEVADHARCHAGRNKRCDNLVLVDARAAGDTTLSLFLPPRALIDRIGIEVRPATRGRFAITAPGDFAARVGREVTLGVGQSAEVEATLYDEAGRELLAPEGVHWAVAKPEIASVTAWFVGGGAEVSAGLSVSLQGLATGTTSLQLRVPGLDDDLTVRVEE